MSNIFTDVKDETEKYDEKAIADGKAMSILSYIGFLVFIPFFAEKNNEFTKFNAKQGMNLLILEGIAIVSLWILSLILMWIPFLGFILIGLLDIGVYGGCVVLSVIGIVNAAKGKAKELPIVNKYKIIK